MATLNFISTQRNINVNKWKIFSFCLLLVMFLHRVFILYSKYRETPKRLTFHPKTQQFPYLNNTGEGSDKTPLRVNLSWFPDPHYFAMTLYSDYVIKNVDMCSDDRVLDYLVVVNSAPTHFRRRDDFRRMFTQVDTLWSVTSRIIFLLGLTPDGNLTQKIQNEAELHRGVIQGDFLDSYHNLTHKAVMGLRWVTENCPGVKHVMRLDDDVFVNMDHVIHNIFPSVNSTHLV